MPRRDYLYRMSRGFGNFAVWVHDHRWLVLLLTLALTVAAGFLASSVRFDASMDSFFDQDDPTYRNYYAFREDFGADEDALLLYKVPGVEHGVFNLEVMKKIAHLSEALEAEVPFVREVTSLSTAEFMQSEGDDITVNEILHDFPETQAELLELRDVILSKDVYLNNIVSADSVHGAVVVEMTRSSTDPPELIRHDPEKGDALENVYPQVSAAVIREILARPEYQDITFYNTGFVELNAVYNTNSFESPPQQMAYSVIIIMLLGLLLLRVGLLGLAGPLLVVLVSMVFTVAFIAVVGWDVDMMFSMTPNLLIAIGVAQAVHLLSEFHLARQHGLARREALRETMELVGNPCLLAAVSTAVGFGAMAGSDLKGISHLSIYGAFGVLMTFFLTITLLLSLLSFGKEEPKQWNLQHKWLSSMLKKIASINMAWPGRIVLASALIFLLGAVGISQLKVSFNFLTDFKPHVKVRIDSEYADANMGGTMNLMYIFDAGVDGMKDPENLKAIDEFQRFAEQQPNVHKTLSIVDTLKDLNQTFHGDDPAYYKIPESRELIAQYLLMYELSGGDQLEEFLTSDFDRALVDVRANMEDSNHITALVETLEAELPTSIKSEASGAGVLWMVMANYISTSFTQGYLLVFGMIFVLMCLIFRSVKVGLLSMIPNVGPILLTMGYMGWAGINLDYIRMMIATIAIGIAVDDTVHLVTRMRQEFYRCGNYQLAMERSLNGVGHALVITTLILACTFVTNFFTDMAVMASFGSLLIVAVTAALLADLFLMPVLISKFKVFGPEFELLADDSVIEGQLTS